MVFNNPVGLVDIYGLADYLDPKNMKKWAGVIAISSGADLIGVGGLVAIGSIEVGIVKGDAELAIGGTIGGVMLISIGGVLVWAGITILQDGCDSESILKPSKSYPRGSYPNISNFNT